jgi:hypothetical protein
MKLRRTLTSTAMALAFFLVAGMPGVAQSQFYDPFYDPYYDPYYYSYYGPGYGYPYR